MDRTKQTHLVLAGLALGAVIGLMALPFTRWIVRRELASLMPTSGPIGSAPWLAWTPMGSDEIDRAAAGSHPNDYLMQLAAATMRLNERLGVPAADIAATKGLVSRFPSNPSAYATALRLASRAVSVDRPEIDQFVAGAPNPGFHADVRSHPDLPARLEDFESTAAAGEALEPGNAFFPTMRAYALFGLRRDGEALDAIRRASECDHWNDHAVDELAGSTRLAETVSGRQSGVRVDLMQARILLPQLARARHAVMMAGYCAMQAEQGGHPEQGVAIRHRLMRIAELLRSPGTYLISSLVGAAMTNDAAGRPGGSPAIRQAAREMPGENAVALQDAYCRWLNETGYADEAAWARAQFEAGNAVRDIAHQGVARDSDPVFPLIGWWGAGTMLLASILAVSALGAIGATLARRRAFRQGQPLPAAGRRAIVAGCALAALAAYLGRHSLVSCDHIAEAGMALTATLYGLGWLSRRLGHAQPFLFGRRMLLTATIAGGGALLADHSGMTWAIPALTARLDMMGYGSAAEATSSMRAAMGAVLAAMAPVPLLLLAIAATSLFCRVPLSVGLARGLRKLALPLASALVLAYAVVVIGTARQETIADSWLRAQRENAGPYYAALAGKEWPGPLKR